MSFFGRFKWENEIKTEEEKIEKGRLNITKI